MMSLFRRWFGGSDAAASFQVEVAIALPIAEPSERTAATPYEVAESIAFSRNEAPLTRNLIRRFGGKGFLFNLRMWEARTRSGTACCYVPPDNYYRSRFEILAQTGVALRGGDVPLEMRVQALPLPAIRKAAKELGAGPIRDKKGGASLVAACPGAETWLAARYALDGFFVLHPEPWSYQDAEAQWRTYENEASEILAQRRNENGDE
jgi:hypothetical protein